MQIRRRAVFLVGYMGAGKTSVGKYVAERLGWEFIDLDNQIAGAAGRTVAEIFEQDGEAAFRQREGTALAALLGKLADGKPTVVALGGGCFVQPGNVSLLEEFGAAVIFLDASVAELWRRTEAAHGARPLRQDEYSFRERHRERMPHYERATHRVDTAGKSISEVAAEVAWLITMGNMTEES